MTTIHLEPNQVPPQLRGGYSGKIFKAVVCTEMTIPRDAGLWSGGSCDTFRAVNFETGEQIAIPGQTASPWDKSRNDNRIPLRPGFAIIEHSIFCGKDMGLRFYIHPDNATKMLPPAHELTKHEKLVLTATQSLKSSYGGRDRYQMMSGSYEAQKILGSELFPLRSEWEAAKQALIGKGLLNKAGAITVAGRNAVSK